MVASLSTPKPAPTKAWYAVLWGALGVAAIVPTTALLLAGELLESVTYSNGIALWDRPVLDWMIAIRTPTANVLIAWFSNIGGPLWQPIISGLVVGFLCWRYRSVRGGEVAAPAALAAVDSRVVTRAVGGRRTLSRSGQTGSCWTAGNASWSCH